MTLASDDSMLRLSRISPGCYIFILYAGDILLLMISPSVTMLNRLYIHAKLNSGILTWLFILKSFCIRIGPRNDAIVPTLLL